MINIYYTYISRKNHQEIIRDNILKFPIEFQNKIINFKRWQDAQLSLLGRLLLFEGLKQIYGYEPQVSFLYSEFNKPYLLNEKVYFNISHSGEIAICALSPLNQVGVDIEFIKPINIDEFKSFIPKFNWNKIKKSKCPIAAFYDYWTSMEAIIKADGRGFSGIVKFPEISRNMVLWENEIYTIKEIDVDVNYKCNFTIKGNDCLESLNSIVEKVTFH